VRNPTRHSANLRSIVDRIRPSIETLIAAGVVDDEERLIRQAVRANVRASADHLRHGSPLLEQMIHDGTLTVVGAEYSLETGMVDFFDGAAIGPASA
jgi:carbonic anhydrase